jgi:hypothetical protein
MRASRQFQVTGLARGTRFEEDTGAYVLTEDFLATEDLIVTEDLMGTEPFIATDSFLATENGTFTVSERFIRTDLFPPSRSPDRSGIRPTVMLETWQENNLGWGKAVVSNWLIIVLVAAGVVAVLLGLVVVWRLVKCARGPGLRDLADSSEPVMQIEDGSGLSFSFTADQALTCDNPNELEGMDMLDSDALAPDLLESDGISLDDPDELL